MANTILKHLPKIRKRKVNYST